MSSLQPSDARGQAGSADPPVPLVGSGVERWLLDPSLVFLNHGSFGARPRAIVAVQHRLRRAFEASPIDWLDRRAGAALADARAIMAGRLGATAGDFAFVSNASSAVNAVLRSIDFEPGDEILTTSHAYGAVLRTIEHVAARTGATAVVAPLPVPIDGEDEVLAAIIGRLTSRTRLVLVDHVTSASATVLPVRSIVAAARSAGALTLVDGAHAPGMLPLDVASVGAHWYTGNLHKWVCAPVGAAFLHAASDAPRVHPAIISHFHHESFEAEFAWQGTRDITPWLVAGRAWEWLEELGGDEGWTAVRRYNSALAAWGGERLARRLGTRVSAPAGMRGSMASVILPDRLRTDHALPNDLRDRLHAEHRIEVPIQELEGRWLARISAHVYNRPEQYDRLGDVLTAI